MTREKLEAILIDCAIRKLNVADRILAAIEDEKKREVVIATGEYIDITFNIGHGNSEKFDDMFSGQKGTLIFRPDTGKGE